MVNFYFFRFPHGAKSVSVVQLEIFKDALFEGFKFVLLLFCISPTRQQVY